MAYAITIVAGLIGYFWGQHHIGMVYRLYHLSPVSLWSWMTWIGALVMFFLIAAGITALIGRWKD